MTKIYPETIEIMAPIAEVPRVEGEASRNDETSRTARAPRTICREVLDNLALTVPKFDGKLEEWLIFRHFYMNRVHMVNEFTDTVKLLYLRHCVVGELGEQVARMGLSGANYSCAWAMIQGKFENKERELKEKHMSLILEIPEMREESVEDLLCLIESSRKNLQCLRMINVKIPHDFVVVSLAKKLDPITQFEWKIAAKDWEPTVEEMLDYLMRKVYYLKEINRIVEQKRQRGEEGDVCKFCKCPDHYTHQCFMFMEWSVEDRIKWVEDLDLCKKCFRDHYASQCKFRNCYKCNQEHSILLHQETPLNPYPQVLMARRLANMHLNKASDGGTSDEGISESGDSQSSQEENYEYRQESEVPTEQEVQTEQEVRIMQEIQIAQETQKVQEAQKAQEAQIAEEAEIEHEVQVEHYIDHEGVFRGHEDILSPEVSTSEKQMNNDTYHMHYNTVPPGPGIVEEQSKEIHIGVSQGESNQIHPAATVQEDQNRISHEDSYQKDQIVVPPHETTCQGDNNFITPEAANQEEQPKDPQDNICQSGQIVVPLEGAVQEEQDMGLHLGAYQENVLPSEIEDEDEQEITIICQKTQNLELQPVAYQEPSFEPQIDVCEQGGQNILVPGMVYQQAQYVAPPEVAYQVEGQNVMPHAMVYPQVQYVVPHEDPYQVAEQDIPPPEMVYQPMQYMCSHMAPYQVEGQMMMPPGMMYPQGQYMVPQEEAYQQEEQNMVLPPGVVYHPVQVQYMEPQVVEQDQTAVQEPLLYNVPYYAASQPLPQQQNLSVMQQHAMRQQHAMQQQVIQQQQQEQQRIIQQQHAIQQQVMQQQHVIHQQQRIIQQQQQDVIRHAQRPSRQGAGNVVNQEEIDEQQGAIILQEEENDGNEAEIDVQIAGRLRPDAEPFEPNGPKALASAAGTDRDVIVLAPDGEVYILSRLNSNAQEFVPAGSQPNGQHITGEVKSKVKQYLTEVVALLV